MILKNYLDKVYFKEFNEIKDKKIEDIIAYMYKNEASSFYITENKKPIYIITTTDILELFINNNLNTKIYEYIIENPKDMKKLSIDTNILDAYYYMRSNKLKHVPVVDHFDELVGEVTFKTLSLKIADIVIKDPLTGLYNKKYFDVLFEEYNEFKKPLGIIFIEFKNLNIIEGFFGADVVNGLLKKCASDIKSSVRDIDFVFRLGKRFKILTFNNLEVTDKIVKRIKDKIDACDIEGINISYEIVFSHVPELERNILSAIESCEKKLIERD